MRFERLKCIDYWRLVKGNLLFIERKFPESAETQKFYITALCRCGSAVNF
jgi:hypothetical protein